MSKIEDKLFEVLEKPFLNRPEEYNLTSKPEKDNVIRDLDDIIPTGFYDDGSNNSLMNDRMASKEKIVKEQNNLISAYRKIANTPEVADAVDEIVDEAIFSPGSDDILELDFTDELHDELKDKLIETLKKVTEKINLDKNIYAMFYNFYVDGQLKIHTPYNKDDLSDGPQRIKILSPIGLQFNFSKDRWEYINLGTNNYGFTSSNAKKVFDREEIISIDSGLYSNDLILSNLHRAIKPANMLNTLEDMLIPLRFSRSVARRIFNIDVSRLNNKKAKEVMEKTQSKFKYKKFYNLEDGTISNQQHISSLTEDYWFPNRGGEKGTTVDTLDETGNLGELGDIEYIKTKLYSSLKVPIDRMKLTGPSEAQFDYDRTSITREELKFYNFISRLRNQFLELFYELMKREVITTGIASESEWDYIRKGMRIKFSTENKFFEKMEREQIVDAMNLFRDVEEIAGKYVSFEFLYKKVLKFSDEEINETLEQIEKEEKDPRWKRFYEEDEDNSA